MTWGEKMTATVATLVEGGGLFFGNSDGLENLLATRTVHVFKYSSKSVGSNENTKTIVGGSAGVDVGTILHKAAVTKRRVPAGDGVGSGEITRKDVFSNVVMGKLARVAKLFN